MSNFDDRIGEQLKQCLTLLVLYPVYTTTMKDPARQSRNQKPE